MATDYSDRQFPSANKTFTVERRGQKARDPVTLNMEDAPDTVLYTGLSMTLEPLSSILSNDKGGEIFTGAYQSRTFKDELNGDKINLRIGDLFYDETEVDADGNPVEYNCREYERMGFDSYLILERTQTGVV